MARSTVRSSTDEQDEIIETETTTTWKDFPNREKEPEDDLDLEASETYYVRPGDIRKKQKYSPLVTLWLAYQSVGVIYGDIGTSPLYVFSSTFTSPPSDDDLLGALSLIIWSLILIVCVKYVGVVLFANDEGEGGTFAMYSLLTRYTTILQRNPREPPGVRIERYMTKEMRRPNTQFRSWIEGFIVRNIIKVMAVLGVSFVIADGILTPAQSILGAVQGLKVVKSDISTDAIVGISCALLVLLFVVQPFGTSKIGSTFAPIVILWLTFNLCFGIYNLIHYDHTVLKAFGPQYSIQWFVRNKTEGWKSLGGILLAFTGVEALFADLGAFSAPAVRLSWLFFAFPCLLFAYIGQAAFISVDREAVSNPFFNTVPPGMYWPSFVLSILAAFVASQAMITGAFQLLYQTIQMSYFPNIKIVHTSKKFHGQIYAPMANWLMMIGAIIVTAVYNNTTSLGYAYGVCVIIVTFITTNLVSAVAIVVWKTHPIIVVPIYLIFGILDGLFLSSALLKVPLGAWFTLLVGGVLSAIILLWRNGKSNQWRAETGDIVSPGKLVTISGPGRELYLKTPGGNKPLRNLKGLGVFFDKVGYLSPAVYIHFLRKFEAQHDITIFFNLKQIPGPHVSDTERYSVYRVGVPGTFRIVTRYGYADHLFGEDFGLLLLEQLRLFLNSEIKILDGAKREKAELELVALESAYQKQIVYIFGKEQLALKKESGFIRKVLLKAFIWMRENSRSKPAKFGVPVEQLVEIGFVNIM